MWCRCWCVVCVWVVVVVVVAADPSAFTISKTHGSMVLAGVVGTPTCVEPTTGAAGLVGALGWLLPPGDLPKVRFPVARGVVGG